MTWNGTSTKKPASLLALKDEGHRHIDALVADGVTRAKVYRRLAKRLKVPERDAHFSRMNSMPRAQRAVNELKEWRAQRAASKAQPPNPPGKKKSKRKGDILPYHEQKKAFARLRRYRQRKALWEWITKTLTPWRKTPRK